jgi:hypothetical protein
VAAILWTGDALGHVELPRTGVEPPHRFAAGLAAERAAGDERALAAQIFARSGAGWDLYNGAALPEDCTRPDVRVVALPFTSLGDEVGSSKVSNIIMLGALLEATRLLDEEQVTGALRRLVKSDKWFQLDVLALERGREEMRQSGDGLGDDYLWGV